MAARSQAARRRARSGGSQNLPLSLALWGVGVLVVAAVLVAVDHAWVIRDRVDPNDPAVRVAGAVRSISGTDSVRRATYDAAGKSARVEAWSKYYDAAKPLQENRQYLATEGRLGAQLALYQDTAVQEVAVLLYARRTLLATVTAKQGQAFAQMTVTYSGPLVQP
jgi:hypothetical protein